MARTREAGLEDRILDSAFDVFGEHGFQATTLKEIALGAGISSGSVYTYFPDKESLFRATVNRGWAGFVAEVEEINRGGHKRDERLALLLDRGFSMLGRAIQLVGGMLFEASKQNLVEPNVEKLCVAIGELLKPDEGSPLLQAWAASTADRFAITRVIVLGILTSAALLPAPTETEGIGNLKKAITALVTATGLLVGDLTAADLSQGEKP
jgi:AcrR family transcriptional regulator